MIQHTFSENMLERRFCVFSDRDAEQIGGRIYNVTLFFGDLFTIAFARLSVPVCTHLLYT